MYLIPEENIYKGMQKLLYTVLGNIIDYVILSIFQ